MVNNTKRAVIIKNLPSPYVSEAIVFLKDASFENDEKIITEAEKIIADYINGSRFMADLKHSPDTEDINLYHRGSIREYKKKKKTRRHGAVMFSLITALLALCVSAAYHYISK